MEDFFTIFSPTNPVFRTYAFWSTVLMVKMLFLGIGTGFQRKLAIFSKKEAVKSQTKAVSNVNEDIERMRRAHMNDMENILIFLPLCFAYILTNPFPWLAMTLIKAFAITRILHTLVYAFAPVPQPTRFILFLVGVFVNAYMGFSIVKAFF
ncbi:microsomal glutathione S-transferase 1-like [Phlebotomus argentipes]|uniref:microsomal glutathione S-transferase 1-like n=1 Tax=Phlebotomus argentipes TaxID=94469 RepID=UPI00289320FB|nr:microsomal glutathione S-transferase 1-like [Phlebotomus argentipes]